MRITGVYTISRYNTPGEDTDDIIYIANELRDVINLE